MENEKYIFKSNKYGTSLFKGNVYQGIDITKSNTDDYGYVVTAEPSSIFYQDFEPTTTKTIDEAKKYILKQVKNLILKKKPKKSNLQY